MAKCKMCKTNIPDGTEYCKDCLDKEQAKSGESYLDSLLNSVKNKPSLTGNNIKMNSSPKTEISDLEKDKLNDKSNDEIDIYGADLDDFEEFDIEDDLDLENNDIIGDEELFGEDINEYFMKDKTKSNSPAMKEYNENNQDEPEINEDTEAFNETHENFENDKADEIAISEEIVELNETTISDETSEVGEGMEAEEPIEMDTSMENPDDQLNPVHNNMNQNEIEQYSEEDTDSTLGDLISELDMYEGESEEQEISDEEISDEENMESDHDMNQEIDDEQDNVEEQSESDLLDLLNQINSDDSVSEDVQAITELLNGENNDNNEEEENEKALGDVGEVFSDALKVVSSLDDVDDLGTKNKRKSKNKDVKDEKDEQINKVGLVKRLFGNIHDTKALKQEIAAVNEVEKKAKKKKDKKNKIGTDNVESIQENDKPGIGKNGKKESKKEKKERKKKSKEIIQAIDEIEEDEGRVNRLGASIVFLFFGLLVMVLLVGMNLFSYSLNINNAINYFGRQKYTQAYNEVYGIDIKDEDIEIYDKIMTIMFVNKQLNSYNNYSAIKQYPEALDSLLKGLSRYDKYIELATMLGIETDLNYVREQIIAELRNVFNLSEEEAVLINNSENQTQYSMNVYDVVVEKMNN